MQVAPITTFASDVYADPSAPDSWMRADTVTTSVAQDPRSVMRPRTATGESTSRRGELPSGSTLQGLPHKQNVIADGSATMASQDISELSHASQFAHSMNSNISSGQHRHRSNSNVASPSLIDTRSLSDSRVPRQTASPRKEARRELGSMPISPARHRANSSLTALPPIRAAPTVAGSNVDGAQALDDVPAGLTFTSAFAQSDGPISQEVYSQNEPGFASAHSLSRSGAGEDLNTGRQYETDVYGSTAETRSRPSYGAEQTLPEAASAQRAPRKRSQAESDKKAMLAKALQQANTAVLLDNALNYEGALESYGDACHLLHLVMERTSGEDDKRKLEEIRSAYSNRIEELEQLVDARPDTADGKGLPPRPSFADGAAQSPTIGQDSSSLANMRDDAATGLFSSGVAAQSPSQGVRNSEGSASGTLARSDNHGSVRAQPLVATGAGMTSMVMAPDAPLLLVDQPQPLRSKPVNLHLPEQSQIVPMPLSLSPKKPSAADRLPEGQLQTGTSQTTVAPRLPASNAAARSRANSDESTSWLDTIDESGSSASSVHSVSSERGLRRRHIRGTSGNTDPDFDAAFDAAVEAAYNEGFEPDLEARRRRETASRLEQQAIHSGGSDQTHEAVPSYSEQSPEQRDVEEPGRVHDGATDEYGQGFNFDLQSRSAVPRQSDSSGYSRSTWQSSQASDRATAATSLSTVAEDEFSSRFLVNGGVVRPDSTALPAANGTPRISLPEPSASASGVRNRRLSGQNAKQLKIETSNRLELRKRASTFHHPGSPFLEEDEFQAMPEQASQLGDTLQPGSLDPRYEHAPQTSPFEVRSAGSDMSRTMLTPAIEYSHVYDSPQHSIPERPTLIRKNMSSASLKEHTGHTLLLASPDTDSHPIITPMSSTFAPYVGARRQPNPMTSQRATLPSFGPSFDGQHNGGMYLFDTTLSTTPKSPNQVLHPPALEPCPESFLLRPFWLMRNLGTSMTHVRGGFVTTKLFVAREVWQTQGVKLKLVEDKVANCDLLTAALGRLAGVDTYDADAILVELQSFEEVLERVQPVLAKKLGNDVGLHGAAASFKDAAPMPANSEGGASGAEHTTDKAHKSNSGKGFVSSWRKLRNKSSGTPLNSGASKVKSPAERDQHNVPSVPMTSFVPIDIRGQKRESRNVIFEGANKEYVNSLARLFEGAQVLDQIARQVEDPGLRHSSQTHVGLEMGIRHAAEFFSFYICRFVLADLGLLLDKRLKRGSEYVLT